VVACIAAIAAAAVMMKLPQPTAPTETAQASVSICSERSWPHIDQSCDANVEQGLAPGTVVEETTCEYSDGRPLTVRRIYRGNGSGELIARDD